MATGVVEDIMEVVMKVRLVVMEVSGHSNLSY